MSCQVNFPLQDIVMLLRDKINPEIIGAVPEEKLEEEVLLFVQPKIDELQEQLTKLPPEIHIATQVLEGTVLKTTLNNGTVLSIDFSPLFTKFDGLLELYTKNVQAGAGAGANGWTTDLVVDGNQTQTQINLYGAKTYDTLDGGYPVGGLVRLASGDIVKSTIANNTNNPNVNMMGWKRAKDNGVKFLYADEIGLTKWSEFRKPTYTTQEYEQAYNNGIRLADAIMKANTDGYSQVVLERGKYPLIYRNEGGSTSFAKLLESGSIYLDGLDTMTIDFNGSTLFCLFDSNNKHQYNTSPSTYAAWELAGALITVYNSRRVVFKNGILRGDQYTRSWVTDEKNHEQTYGIKFGRNNRWCSTLNMKFTGFRGDGIQGLAGGDREKNVLATIPTWYKGGLDKTSGDVIGQAGAYHSQLIDITVKPVIDNQIQMMGWSTRKISFRSAYLDVYMFDSEKRVIAITKTEQASDIVLQVGTKYVQFVAYDDERTTDTVSYASLSYGITIGSGMSYGFYVDKHCEFYENHRGGISNLGCGLKVEGAKFYNQGLLSRLGFPAYGYTTQYAINLEDTYINDLYVDGITVDNVPSGIISNTKHLTVINSIIKNTYFAAIAIFGSNYVTLEGNTLQNIGMQDREINAGHNGIEYVGSVNDQSPSQLNVVNNNLIYCNLVFNTSEYPSVKTVIAGNQSYRGKFIAKGNGRNLIVSNNNVSEVAGGGDVHLGYSVTGALSTTGNTLTGVPLRKQILPTDITQAVNQSQRSTDVFHLYGTTWLIRDILTATTVVGGGVYIGQEATQAQYRIYISGVSSENPTRVVNVQVKGCTFSNVSVGAYQTSSTVDASLFVVEFADCRFDAASYISNMVRRSVAGGQVYVFNKCIFDLSDIGFLFSNTYELPAGACEIQFIDCVFNSRTKKSITLFTGQTANLSAIATNCTFNNVTIPSLPVPGVSKVTYDPPSLATATQQSTTVTLTGAKLGDNVNVSFNKPLQGTRMWAEVTATDTVTVHHRNDTGASVDLASGTLTVKIV